MKAEAAVLNGNPRHRKKKPNEQGINEGSVAAHTAMTPKREADSGTNVDLGHLRHRGRWPFHTRDDR